MRIYIKITVRKVLFNQSLETAHYTAGETETFLYLELQTEGHSGLGTGSCDTHFTPDTIPKVRELLEKKLPGLLRQPLEDWYAVHESFREAFAGFPVAQAIAVEAYLNLLASLGGVPLMQLLQNIAKDSRLFPEDIDGRSYEYRPAEIRDAVSIMKTVSIDGEMEKIREEIPKYLEEGFRTIKLKIGKSVENDIARAVLILGLLQLHSPEANLLLDANAGYKNSEDAKKLIEKLSAHGHKNVMVEQLMPVTMLEEMETLLVQCEESNIPFFADESATDYSSVLDLVRRGFDINVKSYKCGGLIECIRIFHLVRMFSRRILLGCMCESENSVQSGIGLAQIFGPDFVDYDTGRIDHPTEEVIGGVIFEGGKMKVDKRVSYFGEWGG